MPEKPPFVSEPWLGMDLLQKYFGYGELQPDSPRLKAVSAAIWKARAG
jgi:hypothetical protein